MTTSIRFNVTETYTTRLLGSAPASKDLYATFIASKKAEAEESRRKFAERHGSPQAQHETATVEEELETISETAGMTVFHNDLGLKREDGQTGKGLFFFDYQIAGFWKESAENLQEEHGVKQVRSKLDNFLVIRPRHAYLMRDGREITAPDGRIERPLRAMTAQGPRVSLACSEYLEPGCTLSYQLDFLPYIKVGGGKEAKKLDLDMFVEMVANHGSRKGRGQWRSGGHGRFEVKVEAVKALA